MSDRNEAGTSALDDISRTATVRWTRPNDVGRPTLEAMVLPDETAFPQGADHQPTHAHCF